MLRRIIRVFPSGNYEGDPHSLPEGEAAKKGRSPLTPLINFVNGNPNRQPCSTGRAPTRRRAHVAPSQHDWGIPIRFFYRAKKKNQDPILLEKPGSNRKRKTGDRFSEKNRMPILRSVRDILRNPRFQSRIDFDRKTGIRLKKKSRESIFRKKPLAGFLLHPGHSIRAVLRFPADQYHSGPYTGSVWQKDEGRSGEGGRSVNGFDRIH